jgi:hypothetical protein
MTVWLFLMRSLQVYSGKEFVYYMVPHRSYDFCFARRTRPPGGKSISKMYEYPTSNDHPPPAPLPCSALGPLKSHVHPHHVIINAALKFKKDPNNFDILGIMKDQEGQNITTKHDAEVLQSRITELFDIWTVGYDAKPPGPADEYVEPSNGAGPSRSGDKRPRKSHRTGSDAESSNASQDDEVDYSGDGGDSDGSYMAISLTELSSGDSTGSSEPKPRPLDGFKIPYAGPRVDNWVKSSICALVEQKVSTIRFQPRVELTRTLIGVYG